LADLEFVQFHPTALDFPGHPALLLSEALRGEGALLLDEQGHEIVDPLLPRDVVARALHRHLSHGAAPGTRGSRSQTNGRGSKPRAYLSLQHLPAGPVLERFRGLAAMLAELGLDLARDPLPVAPAAHYCMGGVRTDTWGRTDVPGLFAAGEVACTGVQGANRLASNSLLECLVFGARSAEAALGADRPVTSQPPSPVSQRRGGLSPKTWTLNSPSPSGAGGRGRRPPATRLRLEAIDSAALGARLDADLGVERNGSRLRRLIAELPEPESASSTDLLLASLIARAALLREESRGAHFRSDVPNPEPDPAWRGRIRWRRAHPPAFEEVLA
jgi:L-aspartate oxidase